MSTSRPPLSPLQQESSEQTVANSPSPRTHNSSTQGPVAILWDIENCHVPSDVRPEDVAGNIRLALRVNPVINGAVTIFAAYGDFNSFPRRLREGCQRTGVKLVDVPNGRKDAADKAILVDMFLFALDNRPPSSIMLISGDVDFAPALHILGQRGYTIVLVIPSAVGVSSALSNAGNFVWDWQQVARGESFLPPGKALASPRTSPTEVAGLVVKDGNNSVEGQIEEEAIVYRGNSRTRRELSMVSQSLTELNSGSMLAAGKALKPSSSCTFPCGLNDADPNGSVLVQPGDLNGLKGQLVKVLDMAGGQLPFLCLPSEYQKLYGRPLSVSEYGSLKLVELLNKMADVINVEGKGQKRMVTLRSTKSRQVCPPPIILARDNKEKVSPGDAINVKGKGQISTKSIQVCPPPIILASRDNKEKVSPGDAVNVKGKGQISTKSIKVRPPPIILAMRDNKEKVSPGDAINVKGKGQRRIVTLRSTKSIKVRPPPIILAKRDNKEKVSPGDAVNVKGKGQRKMVTLRSTKPIQVRPPPIILARRDNKEKVSPGEVVENEFSDKDKIVLGKNETKALGKLNLRKSKSCSHRRAKPRQV